ncbi:MAG: phytoene/squalene synthase family protein [Acidimicrobiales bacterium]
MTTLEESYAACRALNRRHGTTYYWAGFVMPRVTRHHVWALYAFCRYADEIVDAPTWPSVEARRVALERFSDRFFTDLAAGHSDHLILRAVVHTARAFDLGADLFRRFLRSMAMDLTTTHYETYDDLRVYMDGSAAVIGEMMLPLLEPSSDEAVESARALGEAFQLTNFLRDVGEDLGRGRVYLPREDLRAFDVDPRSRCVDDRWRALMRFEIDRARSLYARAERGIRWLPPSSTRCIRTASRLYGGILDEIERNDYDVFRTRARVPARRKASAVALAMLARR